MPVTVITDLLKMPFIPKKITYPSAIRSGGMHNETEERDARKRLPGNFRQAIKNAAGSPIRSATKVERKACFIVKNRMFLIETIRRQNASDFCAPKVAAESAPDTPGTAETAGVPEPTALVASEAAPTLPVPDAARESPEKAGAKAETAVTQKNRTSSTATAVPQKAANCFIY